MRYNINVDRKESNPLREGQGEETLKISARHKSYSTIKQTGIIRCYKKLCERKKKKRKKEKEKEKKRHQGSMTYC